MFLKYIQKWDFPHFPWHLIPVLDHPLQNTSSNFPQCNLRLFPCLINCHLRKEASTLLAITSFQLHRAVRSLLSLLFSRPKPHSFHYSSQISFFQSLHLCFCSSLHVLWHVNYVSVYALVSVCVQMC